MFEISADTSLLYGHLKTMKPGDTASYTDLSAVIGRDVRGKAYSNLNSARKKAFKADGLQFVAEHNKGLRCISDVEVVDAGTDRLRTLHRAARRAGERLSAVRDFEALPSEAKAAHNTALTMLSALTTITHTKRIEQVSKLVAQQQKALPLATTLALFAK